jgi:hypothetical protein
VTQPKWYRLPVLFLVLASCSWPLVPWIRRSSSMLPLRLFPKSTAPLTEVSVAVPAPLLTLLSSRRSRSYWATRHKGVFPTSYIAKPGPTKASFGGGPRSGPKTALRTWCSGRHPGLPLPLLGDLQCRITGSKARLPSGTKLSDESDDSAALGDDAPSRVFIAYVFRLGVFLRGVST